MNRISVLTVLTHCLERVFRSNGFLMDEGHVQKSAKSDRNDYDYSDSYRSLNGLFQCDSPLKKFRAKTSSPCVWNQWKFVSASALTNFVSSHEDYGELSPR